MKNGFWFLVSGLLFLVLQTKAVRAIRDPEPETTNQKPETRRQ